MLPPGSNPDGGSNVHKDGAVGSDGTGPTSDAEPIDATANQVPIIAAVSPLPGELVAGTIQIHVTVDDLDGVADVTATMGGTLVIDMTNPGGNDWVGQIDTKLLSGVVSPNIEIRAISKANIAGNLGFPVVLDNVPPLASLDPPSVRAARIVSGGVQCSQQFDPLGDDTPNDGVSVPQLTEFRARVVDLPNTGTIDSTLFIPMAGVHDVQMLVLDDTTLPLVVDTDGDGICDDINPNIVPTTTPVLSNEAAVVSLTPITPTGNAFFPGGIPFSGGNSLECAPGTDSVPPNNVCDGEPSVTDILNVSFTSAAAVYGIPPAEKFNCMGFAFDFLAANISDGFACVAIVTTDNLGNRSVSAPLRVCVDSKGEQIACQQKYFNNTSPKQLPNAGLPDCTGTVTGGVVNTTACTPRKFVKPPTSNDFELVFTP